MANRSFPQNSPFHFRMPVSTPNRQGVKNSPEKSVAMALPFFCIKRIIFRTWIMVETPIHSACKITKKASWSKWIPSIMVLIATWNIQALDMMQTACITMQAGIMIINYTFTKTKPIPGKMTTKKTLILMRARTAESTWLTAITSMPSALTISASR